MSTPTLFICVPIIINNVVLTYPLLNHLEWFDREENSDVVSIGLHNKPWEFRMHANTRACECFQVDLIGYDHWLNTSKAMHNTTKLSRDFFFFPHRRHPSIYFLTFLKSYATTARSNDADDTSSELAMNVSPAGWNSIERICPTIPVYVVSHLHIHAYHMTCPSAFIPHL
jgi:hypothetical protein